MSRGVRDMGITNLCSPDVHPSQTFLKPSPKLLSMPSGLKRFYGRGHLHFITASCYRRQPLLGSAWQRDLFVKVLEQVRQRYRLVVVGYVVMPEHFHLLISEPERANPSVVIQALKLGVARRILAAQKRKRSEKQGSLWADASANRLWQARFYDCNVWSGRKHRQNRGTRRRKPPLFSVADETSPLPITGRHE